jgi:hypothetical protein
MYSARLLQYRLNGMSEVQVALTLTSKTAFWNLMCEVGTKRYGGKRVRHLQGRKALNPEDGSSMFLRNAGYQPSKLQGVSSQ